MLPPDPFLVNGDACCTTSGESENLFAGGRHAEISK